MSIIELNGVKEEYLSDTEYVVSCKYNKTDIRLLKVIKDNKFWYVESSLFNIRIKGKFYTPERARSIVLIKMSDRIRQLSKMEVNK